MKLYFRNDYPSHYPFLGGNLNMYRNSDQPHICLDPVESYKTSRFVTYVYRNWMKLALPIPVKRIVYLPSHTHSILLPIHCQLLLPSLPHYHHFHHHHQFSTRELILWDLRILCFSYSFTLNLDAYHNMCPKVINLQSVCLTWWIRTNKLLYTYHISTCLPS